MSSQDSRSVNSSMRSVANNRNSMMVCPGEEAPGSPKFIQHITNNDSHFVDDDDDDRSERLA